MVVKLTKTAKKNLFNVTEYLEKERGSKIADEFLLKFESPSENISTQPRSFPISESAPGTRIAKLTKHNTVYFRIYPGFISILKIKDSRKKSYKR
jgi:hypothetical protein